MSSKFALMGVVSAVAGLSLSAGSANADQPYGGPAYGVPECSGPGPCQFSVQVLPHYAPAVGPITVQHRTPFDGHRSIRFRQAPNVSILRVHGLPESVGLGDAPTGFSGGCHPHSTQYCRSSDGRDAPITIPTPAPYPKPYPIPKVASALSTATPAPTPTRTYVPQRYARSGSVITAPMAGGSGYPGLAGGTSAGFGTAPTSSSCQAGSSPYCYSSPTGGGRYGQ